MHLLIEFEFGRQDSRESGLIRVTGVRALLDFYHIEILKHLEAMASANEQDDVTCAEHAAGSVFLLLRIEVDAQLSFADEESLLRVEHLPTDWIMRVGRDDLPGRIRHGCNLLGKFVGCEELNPQIVVFGRYYDGA